jgi:hypothetical protein
VPAQTRLAQLIAREEGFGIPGAIPTVTNNPGDLEHAPGIQSWDGATGVEPSDDQGWADLERQLQLYASRGMTLRQMVDIYAPPSENDTANYLTFLTATLGYGPDTPLTTILKIPAAQGV